MGAHEEHPVAKALREARDDYDQVIAEFDREALTERWHHLFMTWPSDGWDGAAIARGMHNAKVKAVENRLAILHVEKGHGPFEAYMHKPPHRCICQQASWPDCNVGDLSFFDQNGKLVLSGHGIPEVPEEEGDKACMDGRTCCMRKGDVVIEIKTGNRGLVEGAHTSQAPPHAAIWSSNDACIRLGPGHHLTTNMHGEWRSLPEGFWTTQERVQSVLITWERPAWIPLGTEIDEFDSLEFALMRALLTPEEVEKVFDGYDEPHFTCDLALQIASCLDERKARSSGG